MKSLIAGMKARSGANKKGRSGRCSIASDWVNDVPNPIALSPANVRRIARMSKEEQATTLLFLLSIARLAQGKAEMARKELVRLLGGKRKAENFGSFLETQLAELFYIWKLKK